MLQIDVQQRLQLPISALVGKAVAVLGITGSGKTNTAAVLIEELLHQGMPLTIIDIEGEYWGLKERYALLVAGRSEHAELALDPAGAAVLAKTSVERGISIILDLSEHTQQEAYTLLTAYLQALWEAASKAKRPYEVVIEEAHEWIPQSIQTPLKQLITRMALRGRKRGLGMILLSQRSAKVEKDVLTQAALLFLHRVVHPTDMKVYQDLIPLPSKEVEQLVGELQPGQVIVVHDHRAQTVQVRRRQTFHAGATPEFGEVPSPPLRRIDEALLKELRKAIAAAPAPKEEQHFEKRIQHLEAQLAEKDAIIARQTEEIALLSRLTVQMEGPSPRTVEIDQATIRQVQMPGAVAFSPQAHRVESSSIVTHPEATTLRLPFNERKWNSYLLNNSGESCLGGLFLVSEGAHRPLS